jgi:hypothetical protein
MKQYRILYRWSGREYATTMPGRDAHQAKLLADVTIMPGAVVFAVEVTQ